MNNDLALIVNLAVTFITESNELSDESFATLKDIVSQLKDNPLDEEWYDDDVVDRFALAFETLKEITEAYDDLEYEESNQYDPNLYNPKETLCKNN